MSSLFQDAAREAKYRVGNGTEEVDLEYISGFRNGAVWAAQRATPTREQIAEACEHFLSSRFTDPGHPQLEFVVEDSYGCADAVLALLKGEEIE